MYKYSNFYHHIKLTTSYYGKLLSSFSIYSQVTQCNAPPLLISGIAYIGIIFNPGNNLPKVSIAAKSVSQSIFFDMHGSKIAFGSLK